MTHTWLYSWHSSFRRLSQQPYSASIWKTNKGVVTMEDLLVFSVFHIRSDGFFGGGTTSKTSWDYTSANGSEAEKKYDTHDAGALALEEGRVTLLTLFISSSESSKLKGTQQGCVWWIVKITHTSSASSSMNSADLIIFLDTGRPRGRLSSCQSRAHEGKWIRALLTRYWCWP